jgi:excisionase family DNA binding protein
MDRDESLTISVPEAGRRLGIGRSSAYQAAAVGQIPTIRIGGLLRVPQALARHCEGYTRPRKGCVNVRVRHRRNEKPGRDPHRAPGQIV